MVPSVGPTYKMTYVFFFRCAIVFFFHSAMFVFFAVQWWHAQRAKSMFFLCVLVRMHVWSVHGCGCPCVHVRVRVCACACACARACARARARARACDCGGVGVQGAAADVENDMGDTAQTMAMMMGSDAVKACF